MFPESLSLLQLCISGVALVAVRVAIRNIWFHPLSHFPGPRVCAASRLPYLYHKIRGTYYREVLDMFETYGPIVRVAPDELAFSHADAWKDIYGLLPGRKQNRKDFNVWPPRQKGWSRTLPLASDLVNSLLRRNAAPAFSPTAVREQEHTLVKYVDQLTARLREAANSAPSGTTSQNMCEWFDFLTVDITGEIGFSERLHCIEHARLHPWIKTIIASLSIGTMLSQVNRSGVVSMVQAVVPERILSHLNKPAKHAGMVVQRRLQRERESAVPVKDIFTTFLSFGQHGRALDRSELESNATFLIMGGGDTVAALLSGAMWFLCTRKDALRRLQQELRLAFETSQGINLEVLSGLKYLTAVINECLRMLPPIPEGTPRIVSTEGGQNIAGRWTPEGTSVAIPTWAANRCGENFHKPHEFLPERWLGEVTKGIGDNLSASQPFSTGPRYCIGVNFAMAEIRLALAKILFDFNVELDVNDAGTQQWERSLKVFGVWARPPLMISLRPLN